MSNLKLLSKILRLEGRKITRFWFKNRNKELHLSVKPYKNRCRCPGCGRRGRIVRQTTELRSLVGSHPNGHESLALVCTEGDPLSNARAGARDDSMGADLFTHHLPPAVTYLRPVPDHDPEGCHRDLKMASSALSDLLHRIITRVRHGHRIRGLVTLDVDEISFCKGHKYATLVYELDRSHAI